MFRCTQSPHRRPSVSGCDPAGPTPTANAAPCLPPVGVRQGPLIAWLRLQLSATLRRSAAARHQNFIPMALAGELASLTRWQSGSSTSTRAGRRFLLDLSGGPLGGYAGGIDAFLGSKKLPATKGDLCAKVSLHDFFIGEISCIRKLRYLIMS